MIAQLILAFLLQTPVPPVTPTLQPLASIKLQCQATGISPTAVYQWQKIEGPVDVPFSPANARDTTASFIEQGTYLVRCVVNDPPAAPTWADWALVVGANYVPLPPPTSTVKVVIAQVPPPDVTDNIKPVISKVMVGALQIMANATVTAPATGFLGFNVTASDNVGIQSSQLIIDNYHVYSAGAIGKLPLAFNLWWMDTPIPMGLHSAMIRVYDGVGNMAEFPIKIMR